MTELIDARALSSAEYSTAKAALVSAARRGNTFERQQAPVVPVDSPVIADASTVGNVGTTGRTPTPVIAPQHVSNMTPAEYAAHKRAAIKGK
jgi:hypothetical protein